MQIFERHTAPLFSEPVENHAFERNWVRRDPDIRMTSQRHFPFPNRPSCVSPLLFTAPARDFEEPTPNPIRERGFKPPPPKSSRQICGNNPNPDSKPLPQCIKSRKASPIMRCDPSRAPYTIAGKEAGTMSQGRTQQIWVDAAKGGAILLVVVGHAWRGLEAAGLLPGAPEGLFAAIDSRIYAFHMPLFFLLAGLFMVPSLCRRSVSAFVTSRVMRLLYPLALWTYVFALAKGLAGGWANTPLTLGEMRLSP